jgi:hypothetical protein
MRQSLSTAAALWILAILVVVVVGEASGDSVMLGVLTLVALAAVSLPALIAMDARIGASLPAIFLTALSVRWLVALFVHYGVYPKHPGLFAPDELYYEWSSWFSALYWHGQGPNPDPEGVNGGIRWLGGWIYFVFGRVPILLKLSMGLLGAWSAVLSALIASRIYPVITRRVGYLCAVFPSLVLWSSLFIKDAATLFGAELSLCAFVFMRERFRPWLLIAFAAGMIIIAPNRSYEMAFVAAGVVSSFVLSPDRRRFVRNIVLFVLFSTVVLFIMSKLFVNPIETEGSYLEKMASVRAGYASGTGSAINHEIVDVRTTSGLLMWIPIGLWYFFFAPVPFTGGSIIALATSPEMIAWYCLVPAMYRGFKLTIRQRGRVFMPLLVYMLCSSLGWSMLITNVGTIYRYRSQVQFVILIVIAVDWGRRRAQAAHVPLPRHAPPSPRPSTALG